MEKSVATSTAIDFNRLKETAQLTDLELVPCDRDRSQSYIKLYQPLERGIEAAYTYFNNHYISDITHFFRP
jgi:hypothetical protein